MAVTLFTDLNCPFCYATEQRLEQLGFSERIAWRGVEHEPELVLPHLAIDRMGTAFAVAAAVALRHLHRFLNEDDARRATELVARLALSHTLSPSADLDMGDLDAARRHVHRFVTPGLVPLVPATPWS